jgi:hypothetical protein
VSLVLFIVGWISNGWFSGLRADYTIRVDYSQTSSGVPLGDTILRNGGAILLNYSGVAGQPDNISFSDNRTDRNISVTLFADPIKIQADNTSTNQFQDLNVSKVVSLRTEVAEYSRVLSDRTVVSTIKNETFAVEANYILNVKFGYTATSAVAEYQYYFNTVLPAPLADGSAPLGAGDFNTTDANAVVPWHVIAKYGTGTNLVGIVRVVDIGGYFSEDSFRFDIHPTAVPEPGAIWLIGITAIGFGGRFGWRKWKQRRG